MIVVEDDDEIRATLRDVLEAEGYEVHTAANGQVAMDLLPEVPRPCVMLVDLMMPVMSGWELVEALRKDRNFSKIPITIVSAVGGEGRIGDTRFIPKPIDLDRLLDAVNEDCA